MKIAVPEPLLTVCESLPGLYLVGGGVRDALLGRPHGDIDVASAFMPEEVVARAGGEIVNRRLGTVLLQLGGGVTAEHTTFRTESYGSGGAHDPVGVQLGATMEQDAFRRDFTVNALYARVTDGEVLDPTGRGISDLAARRLMTTTPDPRLIIDDDALRMLRMARFAGQLGFSIAPELFSRVRQNAAMLLDISAERIWAELCQILLIDKKGGEGAVRRSLLILNAAGLMKVIFPEFDGAEDIGYGSYHKYNVMRHCIETCQLCAPDLTMRLVGLLHDIGKPQAFRTSGSMHGHDIIGAKLANDALLRLRAPNALREKVCRLISIHMYDLNGKAKPETLRRAVARFGKEDFSALADIREADVIGSGMNGSTATAERFRETLSCMEAEGAPFSLRDLAVSGADILAATGAKPGPWLGGILQNLLEWCAARPGRNRRELLLDRVYQLLGALTE